MDAQSGGKSANPTGVFLRCTGQDDPLQALQAVKALRLETVQVSKLPDRFCIWARRGARRPIAGVTSTRARQASGNPANASSMPSDLLAYAMVFGAIYSLSSGASHSAQYALAAVLKAVNDGELNYVDGVHEYGEKAHAMTRVFTDHGFRIVYDTDVDAPIADGFYFTFSCPGLTGEELLRELLLYGVSAIALATTGSERTEGLRACTSLIQRSDFPALNERLAWFHRDHKAAGGA